MHGSLPASFRVPSFRVAVAVAVVLWCCGAGAVCAGQADEEPQGLHTVVQGAALDTKTGAALERTGSAALSCAASYLAAELPGWLLLPQR